MNRLEWLKERQTGIGGSDVGAIMGFNKYKTALDVYLDKVNPIEEVKEENECIYWGNVLEEIVAKEFTRRTGKKVRRETKHFRHKKYPFMVANIDRKVVGEEAVLECKTANQFLLKEWEEEEVPASYLLQVQHYLAVTGYKKGYIAVLVGGQKFIFKEIERDEELIKIIEEECQKFWENVVNKTPPLIDGSLAAQNFLKENYKESNGQGIALPSNVDSKVQEYLKLKEESKELDLKIKEIENAIKYSINENEYGYTNKYRIEWKNVSSNRVDSKLLKKDYPDIWAVVAKETKSRRFNIKEVL